MARTAFASVRAMSLSPSDSPSPIPSPTTLIEHAQGRVVDVRERSS